MTRGKDVVRRRCRGKGSLQRRGVSSCVQWKVNGTLPTALFPISMHSSHWLADKVQRSTDCFFFPEPPGGVVPRGEGGRCQRIGPVSRPSGPKVRGLRDRFCPLSLHPLAARLGIPTYPLLHHPMPPRPLALVFVCLGSPSSVTVATDGD